MTGSDKSVGTKPLAELAAPFGQKIELFDASPADDVRLMRVRIRERSRFTVFDIDPATADAWGNALKDWATATGALGTKGSSDE